MDDNSAYIQDITVHLMRGGSFDDSGDFLLHIENTKTNLILKKLGFTWNAADAEVFNRVKGQTILEISSWGCKYYINYEEYIEFVDKNSNYVFNNIVYIER